MAGENNGYEDIGFHEGGSPGGFDDTNDSVDMLRKFTRETGTELEITKGSKGERVAKIVAVVVDTKKKKP